MHFFNSYKTILFKKSWNKNKTFSRSAAGSEEIQNGAFEYQAKQNLSNLIYTQIEPKVFYL